MELYYITIIYRVVRNNKDHNWRRRHDELDMKKYSVTPSFRITRDYSVSVGVDDSDPLHVTRHH